MRISASLLFLAPSLFNLLLDKIGPEVLLRYVQIMRRTKRSQMAFLMGGIDRKGPYVIDLKTCSATASLAPETAELTPVSCPFKNPLSNF